MYEYRKIIDKLEKQLRKIDTSLEEDSVTTIKHFQNHLNNLKNFENLEMLDRK